jgi:hypothetical protein
MVDAGVGARGADGTVTGQEGGNKELENKREEDKACSLYAGTVE